MDKAKASAHANGYQKFQEQLMPKGNGSLSTCPLQEKPVNGSDSNISQPWTADRQRSTPIDCASKPFDSGRHQSTANRHLCDGPPIDSDVGGGTDGCTVVVDNPSLSDVFFQRAKRRNLLNSSSLPTKPTASLMDALEGPLETALPRFSLDKSTYPMAITSVGSKGASRMMDISVEDWFKLYPASLQAVTSNPITNFQEQGERALPLLPFLQP